MGIQTLIAKTPIEGLRGQPRNGIMTGAPMRSLDNVRQADAYWGRQDQILAQRQKINSHRR